MRICEVHISLFNTSCLVNVLHFHYRYHNFNISSNNIQIDLVIFDTSTSHATASMTTSMETEKYEVLETIGKDLTIARQIMHCDSDRSPRPRILWYH